MKINGDMLILARESRGLTQQELAQKSGISQSAIAKAEGGVRTDWDDENVKSVATALRFPVEFFTQNEQLLSFGSSAYFYRKRATIPAPDRKRIHSIVNLLRIAVRQYIKLIDIEPSRVLPQVSIEDYGYSAAKVAHTIRGMWNLPDGPVKDLTALIESAGVLIMPCPFETKAIDGTSLRLADMPPLIFINSDLPADRWRFTLAHELAHLVMHPVPHEKMEDEANEFAAELLTPAHEIKPQLLQIRGWKLADLVQLKLFWKVSISMILMRAKGLGVLTPEGAARHFRAFASIRMIEPAPLEPEQATSLGKVIAAIKDDLSFGLDGLAQLTRWPDDLIAKLLPFSSEQIAQTRLRLVQ
jgi:Zn-dependent peptidase ImmA (M78 family)/transcriptional regulator with XRE-family HTH domain